MIMLFPLTNEDKGHLKRLNDNSPVVFALKKLFLNVCINNPPSNEAIDKITNAFYQLSVIQSDSRESGKEENLL